jgi:hypothetical protein
MALEILETGIAIGPEAFYGKYRFFQDPQYMIDAKTVCLLSASGFQ